MVMLKKVIPAFLFFLFVCSFSEAARINEKAPEFTLRDIHGRQISLKEFRGKVVLIDFWASWCSPCKKEFPELNRFLQGRNGADVVILAVNVDKKRSHVDDFISGIPNLPEKFFILLDADSSVISTYNVMAMPTSFIVDRDGVIRHIHYGFNESDPAKWAQEIDGLLK